jgi:hypothetical protein
MNGSAVQERMQRLFLQGFTILDIAEPLISVDEDRDAASVAAFMDARRLRVVGIRREGIVAGYARRNDLTGGRCTEYLNAFDDDDVLPDQSSLQDAVFYLTRSDQVFVSVLGQVSAIVTRTDMQKPPARMWLFGMITLIEMSMTRAIEQRHPEETWRELLSEGRVSKAEALQTERRRRGQQVSLLHCLQLMDKARIVMSDARRRETAGFPSKREAERAVRRLESLRNSLAHSQDIVTHDWDAIAMMAMRLHRLIG